MIKPTQDKETANKKFIGLVICKHFKIIKYIGNGAFCFVYQCERIQKNPIKSNSLYKKQINNNTNSEYRQSSIGKQSQKQCNQNNNIDSAKEQSQASKKLLYAVKIEDQRGLRGHSTIDREIKAVKAMSGVHGFARLYSFQKDHKYHYMVQSLLGRDLKSLQDECGGKFSLETTMLIACQLITRLQFLHDKGYVHRDLKPQNVMIGRLKKDFNVIYLIDFGLATSIKKKDGSHIPFTKSVGTIGTTKYISINSHKGFQQSRRDDLENLGYVLIYFIKGTLPWKVHKVQGEPEEVSEEIGNLKIKCGTEKLCKGLPSEFERFFFYVMDLKFFEEPNYNYLKNLFRDYLLTHFHKKDGNYLFDWQKKWNKEEEEQMIEEKKKQEEEEQKQQKILKDQENKQSQQQQKQIQQEKSSKQQQQQQQTLKQKSAIGLQQQQKQPLTINQQKQNLSQNNSKQVIKNDENNINNQENNGSLPVKSKIQQVAQEQNNLDNKIEEKEQEEEKVNNKNNDSQYKNDNQSGEIQQKLQKKSPIEYDIDIQLDNNNNNNNESAKQSKQIIKINNNNNNINDQNDNLLQDYQQVRKQSNLSANSNCTSKSNSRAFQDSSNNKTKGGFFFPDHKHNFKKLSTVQLSEQHKLAFGQIDMESEVSSFDFFEDSFAQQLDDDQEATINQQLPVNTTSQRSYSQNNIKKQSQSSINSCNTQLNKYQNHIQTFLEALNESNNGTFQNSQQSLKSYQTGSEKIKNINNKDNNIIEEHTKEYISSESFQEFSSSSITQHRESYQKSYNIQTQINRLNNIQYNVNQINKLKRENRFKDQDC